MEKVITLDKTKLLLLGVILILMIGLALSFYTRGTNTYTVDVYQKQIDSLNVELRVLKEDNTKLTNKINFYKDSLSVYDNKIDSLNTNITKIRKFYGEKINDINNASPTELYDFITGRYK